MDNTPKDNRPDPAAPAAEPTEAHTDAPEELERIVEQAVECAVERLRQELEGRAAEAERLANMSEDERRCYEEQSAREREERLAQREAELDRRELRAQAADAIAQRGLPRELGELVDCTDAQSCASSLDALERIFREAVQRGVDERISRAHSLPRPDGGSQAGMIERMRSAAGLNAN